MTPTARSLTTLRAQLRAARALGDRAAELILRARLRRALRQVIPERMLP